MSARGNSQTSFSPAKADTVADTSIRQSVAALSRTHGMVELAVMSAALLAAEWLIPGERSLAGMSPSPFWIPVILISVLYGTSSGIVAAAVCTACSFLAGWTPQSAHEDVYAYEYRMALEPSLWLACALVLGEISNYRRRVAKRVLDDFAAANLQRSQIGDYCRRLETHIAHLERRHATADISTTRSALDHLRLLRSAGPETLPSVLDDAIRHFLGDAASASVFLQTEAGLLKLAPQRHEGASLPEGYAPSQDVWNSLRNWQHGRTLVAATEEAHPAQPLQLRFAPLSTPTDHAIGALCVAFPEGRQICHRLEAIIALVTAELEPAIARINQDGNKHERIAA